MGQVLIIQNKIDDKSVNTIYYHWSAYTESSIAELDSFANSLSHKYHNRFDAFLSTLTDKGKDLLKKFDNGSLANEESVDLFNLMCYSVISGISPSRKESLNYMSQFTIDIDRENVNRNFGMLAVAEKDQNDHLIWSDGTIVVDWAFDEKGYPDFERTVFDFSDLFDTCNADEYNDQYPDDIIEHVEPCIDYYQRADGEHMMEGAVEITMSYLVDATTTDALPL